MKRIIILGPSAPLFKGGIVHFTHELANELAKKNTVTLVSFKRAYPSFLYKGKQESEKPSAAIYAERALIDWANPFSWLGVKRFIKEQKPDLVIVQWWTAFWSIPLWAIQPKLYTTVIVHNISDHERIPLFSFFRKKILQHAHKVITHAQSMGVALKKEFPQIKILTLLHPTHTMFTALPTTTYHNSLLFFGHVRPYKGLDVLLHALSLVRKTLPLTLIIAGEVWGEKNAIEKQIHELGISEHVKLIDHYIPNEEVPRLFTNADAVVLPYRSGTGTAVSKIALATLTPIIGTRVGDIPDMFALGEVGVLTEPNDPDALSKAIVLFYKKKKSHYQDALRVVARKSTWSSYASTLSE